MQGASRRGRYTPPATLAQEGKIVWSGKGAWLIVLESSRLENAKSFATIPQENNLVATRTSIYRVYTWYFVVFLWRIRTPVSTRVTTELISLAWQIGADIGGAGLVHAGYPQQVEKTQEAAAWNMWLEWHQRDGCFRSRQSHWYPH